MSYRTLVNLLTAYARFILYRARWNYRYELFSYSCVQCTFREIVATKKKKIDWYDVASFIQIGLPVGDNFLITDIFVGSVVACYLRNGRFRGKAELSVVLCRRSMGIIGLTTFREVIFISDYLLFFIIIVHTIFIPHASLMRFRAQTRDKYDFAINIRKK